MSQPRLLIPEAVVRGLVDAFLPSYKGIHKRYCSSFPEVVEPILRAKLAALPTVADGACDFHAVSRLIHDDDVRCYKMTSFCGSWTDWMRHQLNATKYKGD